MNDKPKISVIIPVYKIPEQYLDHIIDSLLHQSINEFEVILVDDNNNNDLSGRICDKYAKDNDDVFVLHQKNQGVSVARNNGILCAKGQWIAFVDADDWLETNYLERLLQEGNKHKADVVMCSCYANYASNEKKNEFFQYDEKLFVGKDKDEILLQLICRGINDYFPPETGAGVPWAKLYRKEFLEKNNLKFDPKLVRMQDNVFNLYAIENADRVYFFNEFLYHYRKNTGSVTKKYNPQVIEYFERVNEATKDYIAKFQKSDIFIKALYAKILIGFNSYINLYFWPLIRSKEKDFQVVNKEIKQLLRKSMYQIALENVDIGVLNRSEKIYVTLLRKKMIKTILCLTKFNDYYKKLKNGVPEK